jgi:hypothetical protein
MSSRQALLAIHIISADELSTLSMIGVEFSKGLFTSNNYSLIDLDNSFRGEELSAPFDFNIINRLDLVLERSDFLCTAIYK